MFGRVFILVVDYKVKLRKKIFMKTCILIEKKVRNMFQQFFFRLNGKVGVIVSDVHQKSNEQLQIKRHNLVELVFDVALI